MRGLNSAQVLGSGVATDVRIGVRVDAEATGTDGARRRTRARIALR
jgi:hypothetical protein